MLHVVWNIYIYMYHKSKPNVGNYSSLMGHFGLSLGVGFENRPNISQQTTVDIYCLDFNGGKFSGRS